MFECPHFQLHAAISLLFNSPHLSTQHTCPQHNSLLTSPPFLNLSLLLIAWCRLRIACFCLTLPPLLPLHHSSSCQREIFPFGSSAFRKLIMSL